VRNNLTASFGTEKSAAEIEAIARENFRRISENLFCSIKTASMSFAALRPHLEFTGQENLPPPVPGGKPQNIVIAIGHFGNFELFARAREVRPDFTAATTYRALNQQGLDRLLQDLRKQSPCEFFERRAGGAALRKLLNDGGVLLGLLADQSSRGLRAPFLGRDCHTSLAPAILALRYDAALMSAICYRVELAKWRVELSTSIPTRMDGKTCSPEDLMLEVNRRFETAIRRDPANWFWVHRRWKN
jgi:lauroyl/myristoyl acyltransferase